MVYTTKTGLLKLVPTLTKSGNLTKKEKVPSIIFKPDNYIIHPEIINGTEITYPSVKTKIKKTPIKTKMKKMKEEKEANIVNYLEEINKNKEEINKFEKVEKVIERFDPDFTYLDTISKHLKQINNIDFFNYIYYQITNHHIKTRSKEQEQEMITILTKLIREEHINVKQFNNYITDYNKNQSSSALTI